MNIRVKNNQHYSIPMVMLLLIFLGLNLWLLLGCSPLMNFFKYGAADKKTVERELEADQRRKELEEQQKVKEKEAKEREFYRTLFQYDSSDPQWEKAKFPGPDGAQYCDSNYFSLAGSKTLISYNLTETASSNWGIYLLPVGKCYVSGDKPSALIDSTTDAGKKSGSRTFDDIAAGDYHVVSKNFNGTYSVEQAATK